MKARWTLLPLSLAALGLAILLVALGSSLRPTGGGPPGAIPSATCSGTPPTPSDLARSLVGAWFRLDPRLDPSGALAGMTLSWGPSYGRGWTLDLPPAASASGPFGGSVLVALDDGVTSQLRLLDAATGCAAPVGAVDDVIWRATIDVRAGVVYEARLDRGSRRDLGIWKRPLDQPGQATRVLDPLPADDRSTEFTWSLDGSRLAVTSCGAALCHVRLLDPSTDDATTFADPDLGDVIGVGAADLVRYRRCIDVSPCPVRATAIATGASRDLVSAAGHAVLTRFQGHELLAYEEDDALGILELGTGIRRSLPLFGLRLLPNPERAQAGVVPPAGWLAVSSDGRYSGLPGATAPRFLRLIDGRMIPPQEVRP